MANICWNTIHASAETIAALFNDKGEVDFNLIMPASDDPAWPGWGTTTNPGKHFNLSTDKTYLWFDSRWSPPVNLVDALAAKFPDDIITLEYEEAGMCFAGKDVYHKGTITHTNRDWIYAQSSCPLCEDGYGIDEEIAKGDKYITRTCDECGVVYRYYPNSDGTGFSKIEVQTPSGDWLEYKEED